MKGLEYMEHWLRREPCHNSFRVWVNDDGGIRLHVCDFNGHRYFDAPTIYQSISKLQDEDE